MANQRLIRVVEEDFKIFGFIKNNQYYRDGITILIKN